MSLLWKKKKKTGDWRKVDYPDQVSLFLISFSSENIKDEDREKNRNKADKQNVYFYSLFDGWYGELKDYEIRDFGKKVLSIVQRSPKSDEISVKQ